MSSASGHSPNLAIVITYCIRVPYLLASLAAIMIADLKYSLLLTRVLRKVFLLSTEDLQSALRQNALFPSCSVLADELRLTFS